jgi:hypothetical protein
MTRVPAPPASRLPAASLVLGGTSSLFVVVAIFWLGTFYAEAVFLPMGIVAAVIVLVSAAGVWVATAALLRRARPRWMSIVGLIASVLPLLVGLYLAVGLVALMIFFATPHDYYGL